MKSNVPWSVKGIDPEARVVAKEAARKAGMTLGEWMSTMIREVGSDDPADAAESDKAPAATGVNTEQLRAVVDSLNRLNERLKATEDSVKRADQRSREVVGGLNQGLETVFERLKRVERERTEGTSPELAERLDRLEQSRQGRERVESLKALESALSQMVEQFEATRQDTLARVSENEDAVRALSGRVDGLDRRIDEGLQEVTDAIAAVNAQIDHTERSAKAVIEEAKAAASSTDAEFVERTGKKLQLLGNEIHRSGEQISAVEGMVSSLAEKIEAAEHRSAEGIADVAKDLENLREEFSAESTAAPLAQATGAAERSVADLERIFDEVQAELDGGQNQAPLRASRGPIADTTPVDEGPRREPDTAAIEAEFDAVFSGSESESAERISAAARLRQQRLAEDSEPEPETSAPAGSLDTPPPPYSALPTDSADAMEREAPRKPARQAAPADQQQQPEESQNRRLGLPLLALLGLLLVAVVIGGVVFFGFGGSSGNDTAPTPVAEEASLPEARPEAESSPSQPAPAPAASEPVTPNGSALYAEARAKLAIAETPRDRAEVFELMREAAIYGNVPAQYYLGQMYFDGTGTERNLLNAKRWFTEAAMAGNAAAMHRLGSLAIDPQVDGQNFSRAIEWFERAAGFGVIDSMYNLGYLFDPTSDLLPADMRDASQSYYWYALATRQGDQQAPIDAANVATRLTREDVASIDADVAQWEPRPSDPTVNDGLQIAN